MSFFIRVVLFCPILSCFAALDGYVVQDTPALDVNSIDARYRIASVLPRGTHVYDVEPYGDIPSNIYREAHFAYSTVTTIDGLKFLVRDKDLKRGSVAQDTLEQADFFILRPMPLCEYPTACRDMKQKFPVGVQKGIDWKVFMPMQFGIFSGEATEEYQPVELVLNDKAVYNKNYLLPLYMHGNFNAEEYRYFVKKPYSQHPNFRVTTELPEAFQSDCGEQIKDASSVSYYLNSEVGFGAELSVKALTAVLNFIGIKVSVDIKMNAGQQQKKYTIKSTLYGRENEKWAVKYIDIRNPKTNERAYTVLLREVHACRVNCAQEVLSVDATIVDHTDKISEISLTREDLIKDNIRDTTKDEHGILTMSNSQDYFKVLDYLQDRTKGDIPISILNIILSEVNSGRTEAM